MQHVAHACSIVGVFENAEKARLAREDLCRAGFLEGDIQIQTQAGTSESSEGLGFWDSIKELFGSEDVYAYREAERRGRNILILNCSDAPEDIDRAAQIMRRFNPLDIDKECNMGTPGTTSTQRTESLASEQNQGRIPVVEEKLSIGKRQQMAGGVRLYTHVTETPVEEDISLREERVRVERHPADRPAGPEAFQEGVVEAVETREVPVVSKEARVVEEVSLEKETEEHEETIRDTVRRQDVEVEHLDAEDKSHKGKKGKRKD